LLYLAIKKFHFWAAIGFKKSIRRRPYCILRSSPIWYGHSA